MALITHTFTFGAAGGGNTQSGIQATTTGALAVEAYESIAASTTNTLVALAIDRTKLQSLFIYATGALTLKANSSGSPDFTWVLAANTPFVWVTGMPYPTTNTPLGSFDITTGFYVTNASVTTAAVLYILANIST